MKIYLVASGSYSDYRVEAVFSTYDLAEKYYNEFGFDNDILEFELDSGVKDISKRIMEGWKFYKIALEFKDGNYLHSLSHLTSQRYKKENEIEIREQYNPAWRSFIESFNWKISQLPKQIRVFYVYVWAKTIEEAVKIAAEKRAQWINNNEAEYLSYLEIK